MANNPCRSSVINETVGKPPNQYKFSPDKERNYVTEQCNFWNFEVENSVLSGDFISSLPQACPAEPTFLVCNLPSSSSHEQCDLVEGAKIKSPTDQATTPKVNDAEASFQKFNSAELVLSSSNSSNSNKPFDFDTIEFVQEDGSVLKKMTRSELTQFFSDPASKLCPKKPPKSSSEIGEHSDSNAYNTASSLAEILMDSPFPSSSMRASYGDQKHQQQYKESDVLSIL